MMKALLGIMLAGCAILLARPAPAQVTIGCGPPLNPDCSDPRPKPKPTEPGIKQATLVWRESRDLFEGYRSAQIGLRYTFLQCAGEIHIACALDPKSFTVSRDYFIPASGGNPATIVQVDPPSAPPAVHLVGTIWNDAYPRSVVGRLDDPFAGEALGMGCFTGQTKKLGTVAKLVGPRATPEQVAAYLKQLSLELPTYVGDPLKRGGMAAQAARAEREKREAAAVGAANDKALREAKEQSRRIEAELAAHRQEQAKFDAEVARLKAGSAAITARNAEKQRAYQARLATHQACVAGDQSACARYANGQ